MIYYAVQRILDKIENKFCTVMSPYYRNKPMFESVKIPQLNLTWKIENIYNENGNGEVDPHLGHASEAQSSHQRPMFSNLSVSGF